MNEEMRRLLAQANQQNQSQAPQPKQAGVGSFLLGLLPGGSLIDKGIRGEQITGGDVAMEAALSLVPFGLGKVAKGIKGIKGASRGADALSTSAKPSLLNKVSTGARELDARTSGFNVGQKVGGSMITPERSKDLYDFARSSGIKSGAPLSQAKQAESLLGTTTKSLDDTLTSINRPLTGDELTTLSSSIASKVADNPAVIGSSKTMDKFAEKISKATDLKGLEKIRREADNLVYTTTGAKKTSAAAQAQAVRESIDDLVSGVSPGYKAIKGDYRNAKDILELTTKNAGSGKGGLDILGNKVGTSAIPSIVSKASGMVGRIGGGAAEAAGAGGIRGALASPAAKFLMPQAGVRLGADALGLRAGEQPQGQIDPMTGLPTGQTDQMLPPGASGMPGMDGMTDMGAAGALGGADQGAGSIYTRDAVAQDIQKDLAATGGANMDKYMKLYEFLNPVDENANKPLSAEASKVLSNANSGLTSLGQLSGMIQEGGVPMGTLLPGRDMLGGLGSRIAGTGSFDTAAKNITDVITRLRTGAALTESEEKFYKSQLPQAFDSPEVQQQKLQMFQDLFSSISNRTGSAGTDAQSALMSGGF